MHCAPQVVGIAGTIGSEDQIGQGLFAHIFGDEDIGRSGG